MLILTIIRRIVSFFLSLLLCLAGLFVPGLKPPTEPVDPPEATPWVSPWAEPEGTPDEVVTDFAEVIALYRGIAEQNANISMREKMSIENMQFTGIAGLFSVLVNTIVEALMSGEEVLVNGIPGAPGEIVPADLVSAKAAYYADGTVYIALKVKEHAYTLGGVDGGGPTKHCFYDTTVAEVVDEITGFSDSIQLNGGATLSFSNGEIYVIADADTGEIMKAYFHVQADCAANDVRISIISTNVLATQRFQRWV